MATFKPRVGDQVAHKVYKSFGVGRVEEELVNPARPSLPAKKVRVRFAHVSRPCFVEDLEPLPTLSFGERRTQLVAIDGGSAA